MRVLVNLTAKPSEAECQVKFFMVCGIYVLGIAMFSIFDARVWANGFFNVGLASSVVTLVRVFYGRESEKE